MISDADGREVQSSAVKLFAAGVLQLPDDANCAAIAYSHKHHVLIYASGAGTATHAFARH